MPKIRLLNLAGTVVGDAEIGSNAHLGRLTNLPDVVTYAGIAYVAAAGAAFDRSELDAVYRQAWSHPLEAVRAPGPAGNIEQTRTGAKMPLEDGETSAEAASALAAAARGR